MQIHTPVYLGIMDLLFAIAELLLSTTPRSIVLYTAQ